MEKLRIHAASPMAHVFDVVLFQISDGQRRRCQGHLAGVVDGAQPLPDAIGQRGSMVFSGESGDVGLVQRHGRHALLTGGEGTCRAEYEGAS